MKKAISLQLQLAEIIYDIQNKTYLTGRSLSGNDNYSHIANMQANDDDENAAQILRSITTAFSVLRNRLSEYILSDEIISSNESLTTEDSLTIALSMPSNFNGAVTKNLGELAHQFIVAHAVADWFAITAKGETSDYTEVAETSLKMIEEALCKRSRPSRTAV
ncbi:MAG: hypothetical protein J1F12_00960 [Muribaculaceae bacterium]|nr:hypothetical protein [Muribaculaceae bacterium]